MHALTYEWRRLTSVRSSWLIPLTALLAAAAVAELTLRRPAIAGTGTMPLDPVQVVTAGLPLLPLPLAALAAGAVGALSAGAEQRQSASGLLLRPPRRRLALLLAKLTLVGGLAALLGLATLVVDGLLLHLGAPRTAAPLEAALRHGHVPGALGGYLTLVVAGSWIGLLGAALLRSAAAGLLLLITVPILAQPVAAALLDRGSFASGGLAALHWHRLFPVDRGHAWLYGAVSGLHSGTALSTSALALAVGAPVFLLLLAQLLLMPRRSGF